MVIRPQIAQATIFVPSGGVFTSSNNVQDALFELLNYVQITYITSDDNARVTVEINGAQIGVRRIINFIEGSGIDIVGFNDEYNEAVDITISNSNTNIFHSSLSGLASSDDHPQYILASGTRNFIGNQSLGGYKFTNSAEPSSLSDLSTKNYADSLLGVTNGNTMVHGIAEFDFSTYIGNATDKHTVTGVGFWPHFITVKQRNTSAAYARIFGVGSKNYTSASNIVTNEIIRAYSDGFVLGTSANTNDNLATYGYFGFGCDVNPASGLLMDLMTGTYSGNGNDNRLIDVGWDPDLVIIKGSGTQVAVWKMNNSTMHSGEACSPFSNTGDIASDAIQSLGSNGFTVGTNAVVNSNGVTYNWAAFRLNPSGNARAAFGRYTVTSVASDEFQIKVPWSPKLIIIMTELNNYLCWWLDSMGEDFSAYFGNDSNAAGLITKVETTAPYYFAVGTSNPVQRTACSFVWMALWDD